MAAVAPGAGAAGCCAEAGAGGGKAEAVKKRCQGEKRCVIKQLDPVRSVGRAGTVFPQNLNENRALKLFWLLSLANWPA